MNRSDRSQADALDRVWEALSGQPSEPVRPDELDPRDEALPARLMDLERAAMRRSSPVPQWAAIRDQIQGTAASGSAPASGRLWPFAPSGRPLARSARGWRWWPALELAMGAAVILVLLGVVYGWNLGRFGDGPSPTRPAAFGAAPAGVGSIEVTLTPPGEEPTATIDSTTIPDATTVPPSAMRPVFPRGMTIDQLSTAVAIAIPQYAWPPNYQATHALITADWEWSSRDEYEAGGEWTIVGIYHACAWGQTWLDARESGDQLLKARALQELTDVVPNNPNYGGDTTEGGDPAELWPDAARRAANDDPSALTMLMASMACDEKEFLGPEGAATRMASPTPESGVRDPNAPVVLFAVGISWSTIEITIAQGETITLINDGRGGQHNFGIEGYHEPVPVDMPAGSQIDWTVPSDLPPGTYTFYCSVPGHRALMEGTITILPADAGGRLSAPTPTVPSP